jgi:DNA repair protein RadC
MAGRRKTSASATAKDEPHYLGHRDRLRARLLDAGTEALPDYELLEFLLYAARPQGDTKPVAKELIDRFGGIAAVLSAGREGLRDAGLKDPTIAALLAVREAAARMLKGEMRAQPVISNWQALLDYCTARMGFGPTEEFRLLFLDRKNMVMADERQQHGTVDQTPVYPREVAKRALELSASAVIMVHNHPSGDTAPSRADIEMTRAVREALKTVGVALHDHLVVGRGRHSSFKSLGLL